MIKFENVVVAGWEPALRGMRNPKNSWDKSDTLYNSAIPVIGENDYDLAMRLVKGGPVHAKFRRMIVVYFDVVAPLYWWKEFDTYKIGTVSNSCSTMHKITAKEFTIEDFSHEHLMIDGIPAEIIAGGNKHLTTAYGELQNIVRVLNHYRKLYLETDNPKIKKQYWWQLIQLLPTSYNQRRTIMANYEVLFDAYHSRKGHKLDEWSEEFIKMCENLPYSEFFTTKPSKDVYNLNDILDWLQKEVPNMSHNDFMKILETTRKSRGEVWDGAGVWSEYREKDKE